MKNVKKSMLSRFGIVFLTLVVNNTFAQPPQGSEKPKEKPSFGQLLEKMDTNKDGKLAESEVEGPLKNDFARIDANKDGFITEAEMKKAGPPKKPKK